MQGSTTTKELIRDIDALCATLCDAVNGADWDAAGRLLSRRHRLLERLFASPPATAAERAALHALGQRVLGCDRELGALAAREHRSVEAELKALRAGRRAAAAYADNSA